MIQTEPATSPEVAKLRRLNEVLNRSIAEKISLGQQWESVADRMKKAKASSSRRGSQMETGNGLQVSDIFADLSVHAANLNNSFDN